MKSGSPTCLLQTAAQLFARRPVRLAKGNQTVRARRAHVDLCTYEPAPLVALARADGGGGEQLGCRLQQALGAPRLQLQPGFAQVLLDAARAHDALVEGQLQLAFGRMEVPRGALHDRFEHRLQDRSRDRLLDPAAHAAIADDLQVRLGRSTAPASRWARRRRCRRPFRSRSFAASCRPPIAAEGDAQRPQAISGVSK